MTDKHRVIPTPEIERQLRFIPSTSVVAFDAITAVCVIPFLPSGEIVAIVEKRGLDIPGGHVQCGEVSVEEVGRREALEEAAITLGPLILVGYLESPPKDQADRTTYIAMLTSFVTTLYALGTEHALDRRTLNTKSFLAEYAGGPQEIMSILLERAQNALFAS